MKRVFIILIILLLAFIFKEELNTYSISFFKKADNPTTWLRSTSNRAYEKIKVVDFELVLLELRKLEETLRNKKVSLSNSDAEKRNAFNRSFECELAVIYRKMADWYLQNGDVGNYYEYLNKTNTQIEECGGFEKDLNS